MADDSDVTGSADAVSRAVDSAGLKMGGLEASAKSFAKTIASAFTSAVIGGKQFDDVLKSLAMKMSDMALKSAFKPLEKAIAGGLGNIFGNLFGGGSGGGAAANALGAIKPFASGGVIGAPSYFPLMHGGVGLAGEAGPEAIMPLTRGADGKLGVAAQGGAGNVTIQITTPDLESFRRSDGYLSGQIARAVARGQRNL